jgi:parvulin-like peptidyl-prolyl isomerase
MSLRTVTIVRAGFLGLAVSLLTHAVTAQTSRPATQPAAAAAADSNSKYKTGTLPVRPKVTPQHIEVQHILIVFDKSPAARGTTRTLDEAKKLAYEVLEMARMGADFDTLVKTWTGDSFPGIYRLANNGVPVKFEDEFQRNRMVAAFGNVGFELSPGNIGIADYDPKTSPFGWHIIKRLK